MHTATDHAAVPVDELVALFTGVEHEDGGWTTTPCFTVPLACAIAAETQPASEVALRKTMYGERSCELIEQKALYVIQLGYARFRQQRHLYRQRRGL